MIVLTGVTGGLGRELINELNSKDEILGLYNARVPDAVSNSRLYFEQLDILNEQKIGDLVKSWEPRLNQITLVHLAVSSEDGLAANYPVEMWDKVLDINLKGNFLLTKALLPIMIAQKWGRIIHVSSIVGQEGRPGTLAYSASKTGLLGLSRVLAKEYARFNITSNVLVLGYFEAGLIDKLSDDIRERVLAQIPAKRFGSISNIANAIEFVIKSDYLNGSEINIDGGL